ncbi:unnamed protein product [Oppiella nova]|uniref:Uncharacterized protein n=1 Tax=Oppiella nova TaxID=334625 RepID=A0A7R9MIV3_9ACAR|nr:unnamed protein product [Oppiella nova]CAG2177934.1 unnamed protein product [Oppiella nova]
MADEHRHRHTTATTREHRNEWSTARVHTMSAPQPSASESSAGTDSDQDFDPSADMLVNDFDDEHTLDEEEAITDDANGDEEIDDLQKAWIDYNTFGDFCHI